MHTPANLCEYIQPHLAVGVVEIDVLPAVTPGSDMIETVGELKSELEGVPSEKAKWGSVLMQDLTPTRGLSPNTYRTYCFFDKTRFVCQPEIRIIRSLALK